MTSKAMPRVFLVQKTMWSSQCTYVTGRSWETSLCVSSRHYVFSLYLVRRGGGVYVAYITSWSRLDATFIQLRRKRKNNTAQNTCIRTRNRDTVVWVQQTQRTKNNAFIQHAVLRIMCFEYKHMWSHSEMTATCMLWWLQWKIYSI